MSLGASRVAMAGMLAISLAGCGPLPPMRPAAPPPATARDTVATSASAQPAPVSRPGRPAGPSVADRRPSSDAIEVLRTIPEPLAPSERIAAPPAVPSSSAPVIVPPPSAPDAGPPPAVEPDSLGAPVDTTRREEAEVPVPEPTWALGQNPPRAPDDSTGVASPATADSLAAAAPRPVPAESAAAPRRGAAAPSTSPAPPPGAGTGPKSASAPADTCWRVQVAAPEERAKAERIRDGAQSVLLIPMVVEVERKLYKVRTRDCMSPEAAERLRSRAEGSGFEGAFRFSTPPARKDAR